MSHLRILNFTDFWHKGTPQYDVNICPESIHLHSYHSIRIVGRKILLLMSNGKEHEIIELLSPLFV